MANAPGADTGGVIRRRETGDPSGADARRGRRLGLLAVLLLLGLVKAQGGPSPAAWLSSLGLRDLKGAPVECRGRWLVVVFLGPDCPVSNASIPVLNHLAAEFGPQGFTFVGAYVDPTADLAALRTHAADYSLGFTAADDRAHHLAGLAGATYTPEAVVFTAAGGRVYDGRIDDRVGSRGAARPAATHQDLRDVLLALAAGQSGPFKGVTGYGCAIPEAVAP